RDPEFIFDWPGYRETGAVFWPDLPGWSYPPDWWSVLGATPGQPGALESGQLVIDKGRCWRALSLALHYNAQADYTYRYLWGDKDTFLLAWRRLGREFGVMWPTAGWDTHTILQKDDRGAVLFQHRCRDKWRLPGDRFDSNAQHFS